MHRVLWTFLTVVLLCGVMEARQDNKVDITGKWVFQVESGAGSGTPNIQFKQEGEKLTGHYSGQLGDTDFTGTVKGQAVTFSFSTTIQGFQLNITYSGTLEGKDSMKGTVSFGDFGRCPFYRLLSLSRKRSPADISE